MRLRSAILSLLLLLAGFFGCGDDDTSSDVGASDAVTIDAVTVDVRVEDAGESDGAMADVVVVTDGGDADVGPWLGCPTSDDYVGDAAWTDTLVVSAGLWCVGAGENRPLETDLAEKARVWFAPGTYGFPPSVAATGEFYLPFCAETADGPAAAAQGSGTFEVTADVSLGTFSAEFPMEDDRRVTMSTFIEYEAGGAMPWPGFMLDSSLSSGFGNPGTASGGVAFGESGLGQCEQTEGLDLFAEAAFEGGRVEFSYRGVAGSVSTGPSGSFRVQGEVDGTTFDITDYYRIFYSASHHHLSGGQFAVFFDAPIRGACGLRVHIGGAESEAMLVECDLSTRETLVISSATAGIRE